MLQYFLTNFGTKKFGLNLLKDFLVTCKNRFYNNTRIDLFLDLSGLHLLKHKKNENIEKSILNNFVSFFNIYYLA